MFVCRYCVAGASHIAGLSTFFLPICRLNKTHGVKVFTNYCILLPAVWLKTRQCMSDFEILSFILKKEALGFISLLYLRFYKYEKYITFLMD